MYNKLLSRQLEKYATKELEANEHFKRFIQAVNRSYESCERNQEISENAFRQSEIEFEEINAQLRDMVELKKFSIKRLKSMLRDLDVKTGGPVLENGDDLLEIVDLLNQQIAHRKEIESQLLLAKELAETANVAKSDFLSVISHEIRTPLHAIIGMGHLLFKGNPRGDQLENIMTLKTSSESLLLLINDILDYNKMEAGKLDFEDVAFSVKKLIEDIAAANATSASEQQNLITIDIDKKLPDLVIGDSRRLGQVINNLVTNAIKFTHCGKIKIKAQLKALKPQFAEIEISVNDSGIGISRENLQAIFQPFTQVSSSYTRQFGGTGLGLSISKKILQLLNSNIHVESEQGKGSVFYFTIELRTGNGEVDGFNETQLIFDLEGKKILLVEDTLFNIVYATQLLQNWNAVVEVAENGAVAIEKLLQGSADLVLMDLQMPVLDGYSATIKIREFNQQVPIIALTASATSNLRQKVMDAGMQDYINKPFNPDDFFLKLKKYLS